MRPAQKTVALGIAAAGAVVLVLAAIVAWPEIQTRYHLMRLRAKPEALAPMAESGSACKQAALARFVKEPAGMEALFQLYLKESFLGGSEDAWPAVLARMNAGDEGLLYHAQGGPMLISQTGGSGRLGISHQGTVARGTRDPRAMLDLLPACLGRTFGYPGREGFEFQVLEVGEDGALGQPLWASGGQGGDRRSLWALAG
ncbi:MAG: hypothetical protein ACREKK_13285, partial [Candidatus Methylomirabilales bacterium]